MREASSVGKNLPSSAAVNALRYGEAHIAGVHFHDPEAEQRAISLLPMDVLASGSPAGNKAGWYRRVIEWNSAPWRTWPHPDYG